MGCRLLFYTEEGFPIYSRITATFAPLYDGLTAHSREYRIRPRNVLASLFFRF